SNIDRASEQRLNLSRTGVKCFCLQVYLRSQRLLKRPISHSHQSSRVRKIGEISQIDRHRAISTRRRLATPGQEQEKNNAEECKAQSRRAAIFHEHRTPSVQANTARLTETGSGLAWLCKFAGSILIDLACAFATKEEHSSCSPDIR